MSNLYSRLNNDRPVYLSFESDEENEEELLKDNNIYRKGGTYPIMIANNNPPTLMETYSSLINIKRYFVTPYVYSRLICEKYLYNFGHNNDISNIDNFIYIGNHSTSTNKNLLKQYGITHIVTALSSFNPSHPGDFKYEHICAYDDLNEDMKFKFPNSNSFMWDAEKSGGKVYIHCMCGVSRSVTIALAYMLFKRQLENDNMKSNQIIDRRIEERAEIINDDCYKELLQTDQIYNSLGNDLIYELVKIKRKRPVANPNKSFLKQLNEYHLKSC